MANCVEQDFEKRHKAVIRLHDRASRYFAQGDAVRPEKLYRRALETMQALLGPEHADVALILNDLALYCKALGRLAEARQLYERALAIFQRSQGAAHANAASVMFNLAQLLKAQSIEMEQRARRAESDAREMANPRELGKAAIRADLARYRLRVGSSRIHRFGIFAEERIAAARKIIPYTGTLISTHKMDDRGLAARTYLLKLNRYWRLDGSVGGSGAELINHSCEPNCRFRTFGNDVWIVSLRGVEPGEELLLDYKFSNQIPAVPCYCGAAACRGTINVK
jgi:tetratricopeptide (TPR) repeat protein